MKKHINLYAAEPERLRDICSPQDYLKDKTTTWRPICLPDFYNNEVALVIGTDKIDIISPKTSIKGN